MLKDASTLVIALNIAAFAVAFIGTAVAAVFSIKTRNNHYSDYKSRHKIDKKDIYID